jgi:ATP-dependent Clp protease ATP-binding subunit ClpC
MYEKFTDRSRGVMALAKEEANRLKCENIGTEHILLGLIRAGGVAAAVLSDLSVDLDKVRNCISNTPPAGLSPATHVALTADAQLVVDYSLEEAAKLDHNYVGTEHLLLALASEEEGQAARLLAELGVSRQIVRTEVLQLLGHFDD